MADEKIDVEEETLPAGLAVAQVDLSLLDEINMIAFFGCGGNASLGAAHAAIAFFCTALGNDTPDAAIDAMLDRARKTAREIVDAHREMEAAATEAAHKPADA